MQHVLIEPAGIGDWLAIGRLVAVNFPHEHRERVASWLCQRLPFVYVARLQGRVAGCFHIRLHEPRGTLWLDMIAVSAEARGLGLGQQMLDRIEQIGVAAGCRHIGLQCLESNEAALNLYRRTGFTVVRHETWQAYGTSIVVHERRIPVRVVRGGFPVPQPQTLLRTLAHSVLYRATVQWRLPLPRLSDLVAPMPRAGATTPNPEGLAPRA